MNNYLKANIALTFASALIFLVCFWPTLQSDVLLGYDDTILIQPLKNLSALDYWKNLIAMRIYDVQPIRDLLFMVNIRLSALGLPAFHLVNLCLGVGILALSTRLMSFFAFSKSSICAGLTWTITHGAWVWSLSWVSAQKHLGALFWLLVAVWVYARRSSEKQELRGRDWWMIGLAYALSSLSHPIYLPLGLLPLLVRLLNRRSIPQSFKPSGWVGPLALAAITLTCLALNAYYYLKIYPSQSEVAKFLSQENTIDGQLLLQAGRYFFNLLLPIQVAAHYWPGSAASLIGIPVGVAMTWTLFKLVPRMWASIASMMIALPFLMTAPFQKNVFFSDTYLLLPVLTLSVLLTACTERFPRSTWAIWIMSAVQLYFSYPIPSSFTSDEALWTRSYEVSPNPSSLFALVSIHLERGNLTEAGTNLDILEKWMPENPRYPRNRCIWLKKTADRDPSRRLQNKKWMEELYRTSQDSVCALFLVDLYQAEGAWSQTTDIALSLTSLNSENQWDGERLAAGLTQLCQRTNRTDCASVSAHIRSLCTHRPKPWDENAYLKNLSEFQK